MEVLDRRGTTTVSRSPRLRIVSRAAGILVGLGTQALFGWTVWQLFLFLRHPRTSAADGFAWLDLLLAVQFGVIHSLLLVPTVRTRLFRGIPTAFHGCIFCVVTCVTLLMVFHFWSGSSIVLYELQGTAAALATLAYYGAWLGLVYSLQLSGLGYQTGWTPWWHWFRNQPLPRRTFEEREAYCFFRHPIYLSFLGLIWFTPRMTLDHALLTVVWTAYIFVGSYLKDERLAYYLGATYREYQERVPGYPLIAFGPLGRRRRPAAAFAAGAVQGVEQTDKRKAA